MWGKNVSSLCIAKRQDDSTSPFSVGRNASSVPLLAETDASMAAAYIGGKSTYSNKEVGLDGSG